MFAYGLSAPPQLYQGQTLTLTNNLATALPALPDGSPWTHVMVSGTSSSSAWFVSGDSSISALSLAHISISTSTGVVVLNIAGATHVSRASSNVLVTPIGNTRGNGSMLKSPPQLGTTVNQDTTVLGSAALPKTGSHPTKYVMFTATHATPVQFAVGDSTVTAASDAQFYMTSETPPIVLNVSGMTHFAWNAVAGFVQVTALTA